MGVVLTSADRPGHRWEYWLGQAARECRLDAGISQERVADYLGLVKETVARFERASSRPHDETRIVAGYAELCGVEDPRTLYQNALELWMEHGQPPASDMNRWREAN